MYNENYLQYLFWLLNVHSLNVKNTAIHCLNINDAQLQVNHHKSVTIAQLIPTFFFFFYFARG